MKPRFGTALGLLLLASTAFTAPADAGSSVFKVIPLVSNQQGQAPDYDPNLVNPWGLSQAPGNQPVWASDTGTGLSTVYKQKSGKNTGIVVTIPGGGPTGTVYSPGIGFPITENGTTQDAQFIFDGFAGNISGWNPSVDAKNAIVAVDNSANGSFYTGLAIDPNSKLLFAADFATDQIEVYDSNWNKVTSFTDTSLPAGFTVFNVAVIHGNLYVAFTKDFFFGKSGNGYVDVFTESGTLLQQLIAQGPLNAPWGMTVAPSTFGAYAKSLLVGNLDDGKINAFDIKTGTYLGTLSNEKGQPIVISGLWALDPVPKGEVTFSAGPDFYYDGLIGIIRPTK